MAVNLARTRSLARSSGGNAVRSAADHGRRTIEAGCRGEAFLFCGRDAPGRCELLLPDGLEQMRHVPCGAATPVDQGLGLR